ncbi:hypothetical protein BgAZ_404020 [Babesia gibsoni]|uniref:Uncharacterized protein n=1 Tax=Babesia gibsoni TaxID=33632 RepID=A0AAD8LIT6_BABGI|nr:hypothetical protein BgAZ_404020 [Babesia gibsoni]
MAFHKRSTRSNFAWLLLCMSYTFLHISASRIFHDGLKEPLQADGQNEEYLGGRNVKGCVSGHCKKQRRTEDDDRFLQYVTGFAASPEGRLLESIIQLQLDDSNDSTAPVDLPKAPSKQLNLVEIGNLILNYSWDITNIVVLIASSCYFIYVALIGRSHLAELNFVLDPLSNYCISMISVLPRKVPSLDASLTLHAAAVCFLLQYLDKSTRRRVGIFFTCMVKAALIYGLLASLPIDAVSPSYTGIAGLISIHVLRTSNFMVVRLVYTLLLFLMSASLFSSLPSYLTEVPQELDEISHATLVLKKMVCFVASWPVAALVPQALCTMWSTENPIGYYTFFFTPTHLRVNTVESWVALVSWGIIALMLFNHVKDHDFSANRSNNADVKWWRSQSSSNISAY